MPYKFSLNLPFIVAVSFFSLFTEYFFAVVLSYTLIVILLITYNIYNLFIQKAFSECIALFLFMIIYLIMNDDLLFFNFSNVNQSILNDYFSFIIKTLVCFFSIIYFLIISNFLKEQNLTSFEYLLILLFTILGLIILCSSNDLLTSYLAIELSSLGFYILTAFRKISIYSVESGIKYFIIGAISSAFFLLGSSFLYGIAGSINFLDFKDLFECSAFYYDFYDVFLINEINNPKIIYLNFVEFGLALILFSLFIKLSLAPFHLYSLDIYEGAPTSFAFFLATITKLSIFVLLIRFCYQSFFSFKNCWQFYSLWIGSLSIFVGSFGGLKQRKFKTLLSYSSTAHVGYILIALSTSTFIGIQMSLFYLFIYCISSLVVWYLLLLIRLKKFTKKYNKELVDLTLLQKSNNVLALFFCLSMFSIAGIPPLIGFISKMNVFFSLIGVSFALASIITLLCSIISTFYYVRIIKILCFENCLIGKLYYPINTLKIVFLSVLIFVIIYFFINPSILYLINYKIILFL